MRGKRTCILCGKVYQFCPSCRIGGDPSETWRMLYCSDNCRKVFNILNDYHVGKKISKAEAKEKLKHCDMSHVEEYTEQWQAVIADICMEEKKADVAADSAAHSKNFRKK